MSGKRKLLFFILCGSYLYFYYLYGVYGNDSDFLDMEAVVVLTGGRGRLAKGKEMFLRKKALYLIISGVNSRYSKEVLKNLNLECGKNVILETSSKNTIENAVEVRKILKRVGIKKILLITSCIHMPRAYLIFRSLLPEDVVIFRLSVKENFSISKVIKENIKLLYFLVWRVSHACNTCN